TLPFVPSALATRPLICSCSFWISIRPSIAAVSICLSSSCISGRRYHEHDGSRSGRPGDGARRGLRSLNRLEEVLPLPFGDLLADDRARGVGGTEVDPAPDARVDDLLEGVRHAPEVPRP